MTTPSFFAGERSSVRTTSRRPVRSTMPTRAIMTTPSTFALSETAALTRSGGASTKTYSYSFFSWLRMFSAAWLSENSAGLSGTTPLVRTSSRAFAGPLADARAGIRDGPSIGMRCVTSSNAA